MSTRLSIACIALLGALVLPAAASAQAETFHRFEALATANYVVTEQCEDGSTRQLRVTVLAGHEEETESGVRTLSNDFLTLLLRGFDCAGNLVNDRGSGPAAFTFSPSLRQAAVTGTITTRDGRTVSVDMTWEGVGPLRTTTNTTTFPGFTGRFRGTSRDAVATGTVVVDGRTLVDGSTTNAQLETLEDRNVRTGA